MEQRRPRLGDIVDDYCPRERRITNHAVVAMIEDAVKQTRCTTCDADHEYKHARVPPQRKKKEGTALDGPFAEDVHVRAAVPEAQESDVDELIDIPIESSEEVSVEMVAAGAGDGADTVALNGDAEDDAAPGPREDDGPVHRRLIRATLPRPEGQLPERKEPDFTIRQPGRGGRFDNPGNGNNGNRPRHQRGGRGPHAGGGGAQRFGGQRHGQGGQGQGGGNRQDGNRAGLPGNSRPGGRPGGSRGGGRRRGR